MTTYAVELSRASYIVIIVEAKDKDEAEDKAWEDLKHSKSDIKQYCWEIESIKQVEILKEIP